MDKRKLVYIVTAGEYSAYHILAVFDNKDMAERFNAECEDSDSGIEEWYLNPLAAELRRGYKPYYVAMDRKGKTTNAFISDAGSRPCEELTAPKLRENMFLCGSVLARSPGQAVKIVNEQRVRMIAMGEWTENGWMNKIGT